MTRVRPSSDSKFSYRPGTEPMRTADIITEKLTQAFTPESLRVVDESHQHEGHAGHRPGGQTHFRVYIVAEAFRGKSRFGAHRLPTGPLRGEFKGACTDPPSTRGPPGKEVPSATRPRPTA